MLILCLKAHFSSEKLCKLTRHFIVPEPGRAYFNLWLIGAFGVNVRGKVSFASLIIGEAICVEQPACFAQSGPRATPALLRNNTLSSAT
ncbi:hypothetical protein FD644_21920 [Serratia fonticola]|nr:hypothetical protein FD644_21920 [Serratia fonticola]